MCIITLLMLIFQISLCSPCLLVPINISNKEDKTPPNHKCPICRSPPRGPQNKLKEPHGSSMAFAKQKPRYRYLTTTSFLGRAALQHTGVHRLYCNRGALQGSARTPRDHLIHGWNTTTPGRERSIYKPHDVLGQKSRAPN